MWDKNKNRDNAQTHWSALCVVLIVIWTHSKMKITLRSSQRTVIFLLLTTHWIYNWENKCSWNDRNECNNVLCNKKRRRRFSIEQTTIHVFEIQCPLKIAFSMRLKCIQLAQNAHAHFVLLPLQWIMGTCVDKCNVRWSFAQYKIYNSRQ